MINIIVSDELGLHRMENPSQSNRAVSLHLYIPPFKTCKTFDERTGHENTVKVTFWSRYGKREKFGVVSHILSILPHAQ